MSVSSNKFIASVDDGAGNVVKVVVFAADAAAAETRVRHLYSNAESVTVEAAAE
jgi:hypothetical protein